MTGFGGFGLAGHIHTDLDRPALVAVSGSFAPPGHLHALIDDLNGVSALVVTLPGMGQASWTDQPMSELAKGFERVLDMLLPGRPIVLFGVSTGNLLTLGVTLPNIFHRVALEPFFRTETLWPFIKDARRRLATYPESLALREYLRVHFGITETDVENRDYSPLLRNITQPTDVLVGELPLLPERPLPRWPSFLEPDHRAVLAANPLVRIHQGPPGSGHSFGSTPEDHQGFLTRLLHQRLREAWTRSPERAEVPFE